MDNLHVQSRFENLSGCSIRPSEWILEFLQRDARGITGNLDQLCKEASSGVFFDNKVKDETKGWWSTWWNGETEGNWSEALVKLAYALGDPELRLRAEEFIQRVLEYQEEDGYIGIYQAGCRFGNGKRSGELWTQSRVMMTLLAAYEATRSPQILTALERMAGRIVTTFGPAANGRSLFEIPDEDGSKTHSLMIVEPLLILHELTGRKEFVEFSEFLFHDYSRHGGEFPANDCRLPNLFDPEVPLIGHGPHTLELLRIPLYLYYHTGHEEYERAFRCGLLKLQQNLSLSGSCKSDEFIGAYPLHIPSNGSTGLTLVGSLPLPSTGYEYCTTTEMMFSMLAALRLTGDLKFADMEEWLIMNAAMAARQPDGKAIQYLCADNLYAATKQVGDRWDYSPTHTDAAVCCAPNSCKVMPTHVLNMWMEDKKDGGLAAVFYGPCMVETQIGGKAVRIIEETQYPFESEIRFRLDLSSSIAFPIKLRIPRWATRWKVTIDGKPADSWREVCGDGSFAVVERTWEDGDRLVFRMEWKPETIMAVDGTRAVCAGPLLYSLRIPEQAVRYHAYPVEGFYDINYTPAEGSHWEYTLQVDPLGRVDPYVNPVRKENPAGSYVWVMPPVTLHALMLNHASQPQFVELVPIGCTTLRRTSFPSVERQA